LLASWGGIRYDSRIGGNCLEMGEERKSDD
jgi:hypothetical protein